MPDSESINSIALKDIQKLKELFPAFLDLATKGPENVRRAVRHFNAGYSEVRDPTIQLVVWCMGVESLFSIADAEISEPDILMQIDEAVGLKSNIYESSSVDEYVGTQNAVRVGDLIHDLFALRNRFVHGGWIPNDWKSRYPRTSLSGEKVHYVDILREVASFVLRRGILSHLERRRSSMLKTNT